MKFTKKRFLFLIPAVFIPIALTACNSSSSNEADDIVNNSDNRYSTIEYQGNSVLSFTCTNSQNKSVEDLKNEIWNTAEWSTETVSGITTYTAINFKNVDGFRTFINFGIFKNNNSDFSGTVDLNSNDINFNSITSDLLIGAVSIGEYSSGGSQVVTATIIFSLKEGSFWKSNQKNYGLVFMATFTSFDFSQ